MLKAVVLGVICPVALGEVPETMRAIRATQEICAPPDFECLNIREVETPVPKQGQALVRVSAASVNPSDYKVLESTHIYGAIGSDVAGTVVECNGCFSRKSGDKVWSSLGFSGGSLSEYVVADENAFGSAPLSLNATASASIPEIGITGISVLKAGGAPWTGYTNLTVVVTSGAGGTGFIGIQLAKAYGAQHVITASSPQNFDFLKSIGADTVVDYHDQDIFDFLPENSVDIVYDNYGDEGTGDRAMRAIRPGGAYLLLPHGGCFSNKSQAWPCVAAHPKEGVANINVDTGPDFGLNLKQQNLDMLKAWVDAGVIKPRVMQEFSLEDTRKAFAAVAAGHVVGKVAIEVEAAIGESPLAAELLAFSDGHGAFAVASHEACLRACQGEESDAACERACLGEVPDSDGAGTSLTTPLIATLSVVAGVGLILIACSVVSKRRLQRSAQDPGTAAPGEASLQPIMGS